MSDRTQTYDWGCMTWLADHESHPGVGASLARMTLNAGATSPRHRHDNCAEIFHVLSGDVSLHLDDRDAIILSTGATHVIPAFTAHHVENTGTGEAELMLAFASGNRHYHDLEGGA